MGEEQQRQQLSQALRGRQQQRQTFDLIRLDLFQAEQVDTARASGASCRLFGRVPVLRLETAQGAIVYALGEPPSKIWRGHVLMRCGPAFGLNGEPSSGQHQNRVIVDALSPDGFKASLTSDGRLLLHMEQDFSVGIDAKLKVSTNLLLVTQART